MTSRIFWDKERKCSYEGTVHIGPTSETHCTSCHGAKRPLHRGIGVHFTDYEGTVLFVTGPECFKKHSDIKSLNSIPTIGFGFDDIVLNRTTTSSSHLETGGCPKSLVGIASRQQQAHANVHLRARILPMMGFVLKQPGLRKFLRISLPYDELILTKIERYVEEGQTKHHKPNLNHLFRAHYIALQIESLRKKELNPKERSFVESIDKTLKSRFGLTDKQMAALENAAARHGLHLKETGIRFPENQTRYELSKASTYTLS